ncbi:MAG: hypothetical protein S4CHLAM2_08770 [Chlamydiales bacterium]|nr:hypothetical protein [Chlamydiales bacterium]
MTTPLHLISPCAEFQAAIAANDAQEIRRIHTLYPGVLELPNSTLYTPLMEAARQGHLVGVQTLIALGANLHGASGADKDTPLHQAARGGQNRIINFLVGVGADVHRCDNDGYTPLRVAIEVLQVDAAATLVRRGALVNYARPNGKTPLHFAMGEIDYLSFQLRGEDLTSVEEKRAELIALFLDAGIDTEEIDNKGFTALHYAAQENLVVAARVLIRRGAKVDAASRARTTPLHEAARCGSAAVLQLLLSEGADTQNTDRSTRTPIQCARQDAIRAALDYRSYQ